MKRKNIIIVIIALVILALVVTVVGVGNDSSSSSNTSDQPTTEIDTPIDTVADPMDSNNPGSMVDITETGTITSIDLDPLAYDGSAVINYQNSSNQVRTIEVPARINLCAAQNDIVSLSDLVVGDMIAVQGELTTQGSIVPCQSATHYLRKV